MDPIEDRQDPISQEPMTHHPEAKPPRRNRATTVIGLLAAVLLIALIIVLLLGNALPVSSRIVSSAMATATPTPTPTPTPIPTATPTAPAAPTPTIDPFFLEDGLSFKLPKPPYPQYATPQAAFKAAAVIYLCGTGETLGHTVTWLTTGLEQGLVLIQGRCANGLLPFIIAEIRRAPDATNCKEWDVEMALFVQDRSKSVPANLQAEVPFWLPLPHEVYGSENGATEDPPPLYSFKSWVSPKHIYVATRYQAPAPPPANTHTVTVHGAAGWYVSQGGMTVITVPLSGNQAFSFAGNGSVAAVLPLAQATLANLGTFLPKLPTLPATFCQ